MKVLKSSSWRIEIKQPLMFVFGRLEDWVLWNGLHDDETVWTRNRTAMSQVFDM